MYPGLYEAQIHVGVTQGWLRPEFGDDCPLPLRRLATQCWQQDPTCRHAPMVRVCALSERLQY